MIIPRTARGVLFWLAFASLLTAAQPPSAKSPQLAVGFRDADHFCIAVSNGHLAAGTHLKIIVPLDKKAGEAVVIEPAKQPCHGTADAPNTSSYELQASKADVPDTIALVGVIDGLDRIVVSQLTSPRATRKAKQRPSGLAWQTEESISHSGQVSRSREKYFGTAFAS